MQYGPEVGKQHKKQSHSSKNCMHNLFVMDATSHDNRFTTKQTRQ